MPSELRRHFDTRIPQHRPAAIQLAVTALYGVCIQSANQTYPLTAILNRNTAVSEDNIDANIMLNIDVRGTMRCRTCNDPARRRFIEFKAFGVLH